MLTTTSTQLAGPNKEKWINNLIMGPTVITGNVQLITLYTVQLFTEYSTPKSDEFQLDTHATKIEIDIN